MHTRSRYQFRYLFLYLTVMLGVIGVSATPALAASAESLGGQWIPDARNFVELSRSAPSWPLTAAAQPAVAARPSADEPAADCAALGVPLMMVTPNITTIAITDEYLTFDIDGIQPVRQVRLATEFPHEMPPVLRGHSIAHWEGETLVIETKAFAAAERSGFAPPSSQRKHVFERFTLGADKRSLVYQARIEDPEYLSAPVDITSTWAYRPDARPTGHECDIETALRMPENR